MGDVLGKRVELTANLAIILVALLASAVLIKNHFVGATTKSESLAKPGMPALTPGTPISLPGVRWHDADQTLLVVLSTGCHFCAESAPLYQRLARAAQQRKGSRLIAVFPQDTADAKKYLDDLNVEIDDVKQASLDSIGVRGSPTLVLVDKSGAVQTTWLGRLAVDKEAEVLARVKCETCDQ